MSSADKRVDLVVTEPAGFASWDLAAPDLSQSPQLRLDAWHAARSEDATAAWACFSGDATQWSDDATDLAQGKLAEIASSTASRARGSAAPMHVVSTRDARDRTLACDDGACAARTLVVFTEARAHGCFVACTESARSAACAEIVASARVEGALVAEPPPGLALRSFSFAVHHPRGALGAIVALVAALAIIAIATRK